MKLLFGKHWFSWTRLAVLMITVAMLLFIFWRLPYGTVLASLQSMKPGWFLVAFLTYGFALWIGGLRWHLALRLTHRAIYLAASSRLFLIGHFFFTILFGAAGGDLAKSAVYARWFRFQLPEVIAAAPLDRALGFGGMVLLACLTALTSAGSDGFGRMDRLNIQWPGIWLLTAILLVALVAIGILFWCPSGESSWARTIRAFRLGGGRLAVTPGLAVPGLLAGFLSQVALCSVFAFNLAAVVDAPLPWTQIAWVFPAITIVSCLPFTVAGAGVREVAALTLLGLYHVPPGDCVAAALLTLLLKLSWAAIGGAVLWREELAHQKAAERPLPQTLSVVIPVINEAVLLPETVRRASAVPEVCEIIVVDGGSQDGTREVAARLGCRVLASPPGRGCQMRVGARKAIGDVILLLHADTWIPKESGQAVLHCLRDSTVVGGGFWKMFRATPILLLGSRWKCWVRLTLGGRIAGDQVLFARREVLDQIGGVPDMALMEEFELCRRLRRIGRLALVDATVSTSARRFERLGVVRTYLRMWWVTMRYRFGTAPARLQAMYEKE